MIISSCSNSHLFFNKSIPFHSIELFNSCKLQFKILIPVTGGYCSSYSLIYFAFISNPIPILQAAAARAAAAVPKARLSSTWQRARTWRRSRAPSRGPRPSTLSGPPEGMWGKDGKEGIEGWVEGDFNLHLAAVGMLGHRVCVNKGLSRSIGDCCLRQLRGYGGW